MRNIRRPTNVALLILLCISVCSAQQIQSLDDTDSLKTRRDKTNSNFTILSNQVSSVVGQAHSHSNKALLDKFPVTMGLANQILGVSANGAGFEFKSVQAGNGITITHGAGTVTIAVSAGSGIGTLNALSAAAQVFANDTNVKITSSGSTHTLGWQGLLAASRGGTNNAFFSVTGPASTVKEFTFPNQNAKILSDASPVLVAEGGSGGASFTGILKGNGTSPFTTVTAPAGALVGTTDTQGLSNKELIDVLISGFSLHKDQAEQRFGDADSSHYVGFKAPSVISANKIYVLPAAAGTTNQMLTLLDPATGELGWTTAPGAAGGEANTASNQGTAGIGLFKQKAGVDLQFRNINGGSSKLQATLDGANNEVDLDVVESNLNLNNIGGTLGPGKGGLGAANLSGLIRGNGASPATAVPAPVGDIVGTTDPQAFENKTYDVEATGNVFKSLSTVMIDAAGCNQNVPSPNWDLPVSNAPVAACVALSNTIKGVLDFADGSTDLTAQRMIVLPAFWNSSRAIGVKFRAVSSATSGNYVLGISTACVADGESDDPSWNAYTDVTDAAKASANAMNEASIASITTSGCQPGELMHVRIARRLSQGADTMAGTVRLVMVEFTFGTVK